MPLMEHWDRIVTETIKQAEAVDCALEDYADGLREIEIQIRDKRHMVEDELEKRSKETV
jgi:hypothetical protein